MKFNYQFSKHGKSLLAVSMVAGLLAGCGGGDVITQVPVPAPAPVPVEQAAPPVPANTLRLHFQNSEITADQSTQYLDWGLYSWKGPQTPSGSDPSSRIKFTNADKFGGYVDIALADKATELDGFVVKGDTWDEANPTKNCKNPDGTGKDMAALMLNTDAKDVGEEIWLKYNDCTWYHSEPDKAPGKDVLRVHFHGKDIPDSEYTQWGVYSWKGPQNPSGSDPSSRIKFTHVDTFGGYVDIPITSDATEFDGFVVKGDTWDEANPTKNCKNPDGTGKDMDAIVIDSYAHEDGQGQEVWITDGSVEGVSGCKGYSINPIKTTAQ